MKLGRHVNSRNPGQAVCLFVLCLPAYALACPSVCLSVCLPPCLSCLPVCLFVCLPACLPSCLFVCRDSFNACVPLCAVVPRVRPTSPMKPLWRRRMGELRMLHSLNKNKFSSNQHRVSLVSKNPNTRDPPSRPGFPRKMAASAWFHSRSPKFRKPPPWVVESHVFKGKPNEYQPPSGGSSSNDLFPSHGSF